MLVHQLCHPTLEGRTPGQQFVGHHRKSVLVGGRHRVALPLLGSHVGRGATTRLAHPCRCTDELGHAEISQQQVRALWPLFPAADEKIGGFNILVNDLLVVGMLERAGGLLDEMLHVLG